MKHAFIRGIFLLSAAALCLAGLQARQAAQPSQAAAGSNSQQASPASSADHGTGVVPPGVKLVPAMPAAGAPKTFQFPTAATKTLSNGLRVFVVTDHAEPSIAAQLLIMSAGSIQDSPTMPGVAQMSANMLTQGTTKRSATGHRGRHRFRGRIAFGRGGQGCDNRLTEYREKGFGCRVRSDVRRRAASGVSG